MIIWRWILAIMRNVSDNICERKLQTPLGYKHTLRICNTYWFSAAQCLHERGSMLHCAHIACLVFFFTSFHFYFILPFYFLFFRAFSCSFLFPEVGWKTFFDQLKAWLAHSITKWLVEFHWQYVLRRSFCWPPELLTLERTTSLLHSDPWRHSFYSASSCLNKLQFNIFYSHVAPFHIRINSLPSVKNTVWHCVIWANNRVVKQTTNLTCIVIF